MLDAPVAWEMMMELNCKKGDLAVIVRSYAENEGTVVTCIKLLPQWTRIAPDGLSLKTGPAWVTDRRLVKATGFVSNVVADDQLRPLRDGEGEDEMLRIAGRPQERTPV